jgi:hypothetical protein
MSAKRYPDQEVTILLPDHFVENQGGADALAKQIESSPELSRFIDWLVEETMGTTSSDTWYDRYWDSENDCHVDESPQG